MNPYTPINEKPTAATVGVFDGTSIGGVGRDIKYPYVGQPIFQEAEAFLDALDPDAKGFTFQTFDDDQDRKDGTLARVLNGTLSQHWETLCSLYAKGAGVFITINATDGKGRSKDNIVAVRAVFVDTDGADIEPIRAADPHMIVKSSPGNYHGYWNVTDCPLEDFTPAQKVMIAAWGTDRGIHDLPRVMRLPGFMHQKVSAKKGLTGVPFMVRMVHAPQPIGLDDWADRKAEIAKLAPIKPELPLTARALANVAKPKASQVRGKNVPSMAEVEEVLGHINCAKLPYEKWLNVIMGLHWLGDEYWDLAHEFSSTDGYRYNPDDLDAKWRGFSDNRSGGVVTWATVCSIAKGQGADLGRIAAKHRHARVKVHRPEGRGFEELLETCAALSPSDIGQIDDILAETLDMGAIKQDAILRTLKTSTGAALGALRKQLSGLSLGSGDDGYDAPDHLELANIALDEIGRENIICADQFTWKWSGAGVWNKADDRMIKQEVQHAINGRVNVFATLVNGVADVLKTEIFQPEHQFNLGDSETVNCLNGELVLDRASGWQLKPHDRENYRTTQIPVAFDQTAKAPKFWAFLNDVFRDDEDREDKCAAILEMMGYTLMSHARHEKFVLLIGSGSNGKSVLLGVLMELVGMDNIAGVNPQNLNRSFQRAHLHMKLANIITELRQGEVIADAELKAITSGEASTVENKFEKPFIMRPFSTCWFGANHMPHTRDFSDALFRRALVVPFNRKYLKADQDPDLKDKLITELPGILNLALAAYHKALVHGFTVPASSVEAEREWQLDSDQVAQFVADACQAEEGKETGSTKAFRCYQDWAQKNGITKPVTQKTFRARLSRLGFGAKKKENGNFIVGLGIQKMTE